MAIDHEKIFEEFSKIEVNADDTGLISGYGVFLSKLPAQLWMLFSERLTRTVPDELLESAEWLLINAGQECSYRMCNGIITSEEWKAVVEPMLSSEQDTIEGVFTVLQVWGMATIQLHELIPGEKMVVRASDYHESDVVDYGKSNKMSAYTFTGLFAGLMDLIYGGPFDKTGKTGLGTFEAKQTKGIECGDGYGEFVITKSIHH